MKKEQYYHSSAYTKFLFNNCDKFNKNIQNLSKILLDYKEDDKTTAPLKNLEICYLLTHFYEIINKSIPNELTRAFIPISLYEQVQQNSTYFSEIKFEQPLILSIQKSSQLKNTQHEGEIKNHNFILHNRIRFTTINRFIRI